MKRLTWIVLAILFTLNLKSQSVEEMETSALFPVAKNLGLDSALNKNRGFPLFVIDEEAALSLLSLMSEYKRYSKSESFFSKMAHNWENPVLRAKTGYFMDAEFKKILQAEPNKDGFLYQFDDKLLLSLLKQQPDSVEQNLIIAYESCLSKSDSLKQQFPPILKRFFSFFAVGTHPTVVAYKGCHMNCYKIMWALKQLNSSYFSQQKLNWHNSKLQQWLKNYNIERFKDNYTEPDYTEIKLNEEYDSLNEIDFKNEPELKKFLCSPKVHKCTTYMLYNGKDGFFNYTIDYKNMNDGFGSSYRFKLIDRDKLMVSLIEEWF